MRLGEVVADHAGEADRRRRQERRAPRRSRVAAPPRTSARLPARVSTESSATEPTTSNDDLFTDPSHVVARRRPRASAEMASGAVMMAWAAARAQPQRRGGRDVLAEPADDVLGAGDVRPQHLDDGLDGDRRFLGVPAVVVGDQRQRREAELGLAAQLGLGGGGHADDVGAPAPVQLRLGARRELRALHADVGAAAVHGRLPPVRPRRRRRPATRRAPNAGRRSARRSRRGRPRRRRRRSRRAPVGLVDELVGQHEVARGEPLAQRADRRHRQHALGAQRLEREHVRAVVDLRRREAVPAPVPGQEQQPRRRRCGRSTTGADGGPNGVDTSSVRGVGEPVEIVEAAAAENAEYHCNAGGIPIMESPPYDIIEYLVAHGAYVEAARIAADRGELRARDRPLRARLALRRRAAARDRRWAIGGWRCGWRWTRTCPRARPRSPTAPRAEVELAAVADAFAARGRFFEAAPRRRARAGTGRVPRRSTGAPAPRSTRRALASAPASCARPACSTSA